ncbi:MAG: class I SAM-dependent methyltransferase, partial [Desulfobulbaceae bacterium]|nr:class I SAM-dependent methyltransferase [Desulfobulbaceae bacterium]
MNFKDIDWNRLWQEARLQKSWKKKGEKDWDNRAAGFAKRNIDSSYADRFLQLVQPEPHWRVLDIGCGPGTLALPLAAQVKSVTAIDFS